MDDVGPLRERVPWFLRNFFTLNKKLQLCMNDAGLLRKECPWCSGSF